MAATAGLLPICSAPAKEGPPESRVTIGVLKFGTVDWELDVIRHHNLDRQEGIQLEIVELASKQATAVAFMGNSVDVIVNDWIWVSRQRHEGHDFTFYPYSNALGALVVAGGSPIKTLPDLKGKRLGIAGGPLDKSWLLLQALATERHGIDLETASEAIFGATPLLARKLETGELDAALLYWPFAARLETKGFHRLVGVSEVMAGLGITEPVPLVGYVFREAWARENRDAANGFLRATRAAKAILLRSDAEWQRLRPIIKAETEAELTSLRDTYRTGIPNAWSSKEHAAAAKLFGVLSELGGPSLVGANPELAPGTFWSEPIR